MISPDGSIYKLTFKVNEPDDHLIKEVYLFVCVFVFKIIQKAMDRY